MSKHTPGPWVWDKNRTTLTAPKECVVLQDGEGLWDLCSALAAGKPKEAQANALLIAAAPELLEALLEYVQRHEAECDPTGLPEYDQARAAITKATTI